MSYIIEIKNLPETQSLASLLAELAEPGDIITLKGDLGVGKTEFARAFIRSFIGLDEEVPSPTFNLVQVYQTSVAPIWHFDLYRLQDREEIWELGFEEALQEGILLIEWPERLESMQLHNHLEICFESSAHSQKRLLKLTPDLKWKQKIESIEIE
jgi:tRNA threonylcarbamoyladenosine biosynthesis protein TsaE